MCEDCWSQVIAFHEFYMRIESVHMKAISAEGEADGEAKARAGDDVFNHSNDELGERGASFLGRKCLLQFVFN